MTEQSEPAVTDDTVTPSESAGLIPLGADIDWPDHEAAGAMREQVAAAPEDLGRLGDLAIWLAGLRGAGVHDLQRPRAVIFGAEHANAADTTDPGPSTVERLDAVRGRRSGAGAVSELAGVEIRIVDLAEAGADTAGAERLVGKPIDTEDVGTEADIVAAVARGARVADDEVDSGADLLIVALASHGVITPAAALVAVLTNTEPVKVLPRGARTSPEVWMRRATVVRDARRRGFGHRTEPDRLLTAIGGIDLAAAAGFLLQAAMRRTPVLFDGLGAAAAALVAYESQPRAVRWWQPADRVGDPAHELVLTRLGLDPILSLGVGTGDGTAAILAVPVLRAALREFG